MNHQAFPLSNYGNQEARCIVDQGLIDGLQNNIVASGTQSR